MDEKSFYGSSGFREKGDSENQCLGIEILKGGHCELSCEACYNAFKLSPSACIAARQALDVLHDKCPATPTPEVFDYIDQAKEADFQEIALLGGEPAIHTHISEIIRYISEVGLNTILCTNGIQVAKDAELRDALSDSSSVVVTHAYIPGREDVIDSFSGMDGYANQLKKAIDYLSADERIQLVLEMPLTDSLYPHAFDFFKNCREEGVIPFIEISRRHNNGFPTSSITPEQIEELYRQFLEYDLEHYPHLAASATNPPAYGNPCTMPMTGLHIKNLGNGDFGGVYSCCAQPVRHGDLREQTLKEIMTSPTLAVYQDQDTYIVGPCRDCDEYEICKGGCRGEAVLQFGCPRASSPACNRIPIKKRNDPAFMAPESCEGCPLENCGQCNLSNGKPDAT